jgi:hypothetical protein
VWLHRLGVRPLEPAVGLGSGRGARAEPAAPGDRRSAVPGPVARFVRSPLRLLAALVAGFAIVVVAIDRLAPTPSGPEGSSYATAPEGAAAYAELLRRAGHPVRRLRTPLAERTPDAGATLVILDPAGVPPAEARAVRRFLDAGGRLIAAGAYARWLARVLDAPPVWEPSPGGAAGVVAPAPETAGVTTVRFREGGRWADPGGALPLLATPAGTVAAVAERGTGRAVLLADASPLYNAELARADDAAFGIAAAGDRGRPVAFLETVHGYGEATGLRALPDRAVWVLAGLALAALALVWSLARRLGPPEDEARALAPPRRDYVEAVAAGLAASGDVRGVAGAAARGARRRLEARAGLPPGADPQALRDAAARFGLDGEETAALLGDGDGDGGALAAGRALAKLEARG